MAIVVNESFNDELRVWFSWVNLDISSRNKTIEESSFD